ncbi:SusD/RagB family nutrient-binding outer membrane lipoprotein [Sphingobacterium spiritivorum]|uniref:SusD/RagB family nutrient-binding outer membrane lipoprotein n=2 Tax=Sphingobacterium spiritivorum TaxID=258 RepID=UPI003DA1D7C3
MMKKVIKTYAFALLTSGLMLSNISCQKTLKDEFLNPDGYTSPTIESFFVDLQQRLGTFRYAYGEMYHTFSVFNRMLGTGGFVNDGVTNTYSWGHSQYTDIFDKLRTVAEIERRYKNLSADEQKQYTAYYAASQTIKYYLFYQLTDTYNDIPYSQALQGKDNVFFPKFEKQELVYKDILSQLKTLSENLKGYTVGTSFIETQFASNDISFKGDIAQWRSFINSLRMRIAIHLTNVAPELAQSTIKEVLADGVYAKDKASSFLMTDRQQDRATEFLLARAMIEQRSSLWLPENMLKVLRKTGFPDDPRLKVLFQPDKDGNYSAMPTEGPFDQAFTDKITNTNLAATYPSMYNRTTFEQNFAMPYQIITSSEVHLILAEAALRWPDLGLNATTEYQTSISQSIDLYYDINALNNSSYASPAPGAKAVKPSATEINAFVQAKIAEFNAANTLEKKGLIYDQKYVHFNMLKPYELWTETRRLYKELGDRVIKKPTSRRMMERVPYPTTESVNNADNFSEVAGVSNFTSPVWLSGR